MIIIIISLLYGSGGEKVNIDTDKRHAYTCLREKGISAREDADHR